MSLRHAFIICDFGCQLLHIEPIFGSHVPNLYDNKSMSYCDTTALDNTSTFGTSFSSHMSFLSGIVSQRKGYAQNILRCSSFTSGHSGFSTWDTDHQMHRHLPPRSNTPGSWKRGATVGSRHLHILDGMVKENVDRAGFIYYTLNPCIPESQSASGSVSRGSRTGSEAYGTVTENLENSFLTAGDGSEYSYA